jgi:hypothetical protein
MNELGLTIVGLVLVGLVLFLTILGFCEGNRIKKQFKKDVEELKIGNKYKRKESPFRFLRGDNPFKTTPNFIVEIVDVKFNRRNVLYVQYKQIEPEYKGEPFSEPFKDFIDFFDLIK